ncbi:PQQ-binding-like beta-propeller repeat protein [Microtetraspora glauca]|uniref:PQQ-binding-like beta-propeller repeat protein n=1 Tax=Microtetraspora glauca TaxID=1996 RepID=A0ABV3GSD9_MICGL
MLTTRLRRAIAGIGALVLLMAAPPASSPPGNGGTRTLWRAAYPAPLMGEAALAGGDVVVVTSAVAAVLDAANGTERWRRSIQDAQVVDWLAPGGAVVLAHSRPSPTGDLPAVEAVSRADGRPIWRRDGLGRAGVWRGPYQGGNVPALPAWTAEGALAGLDPASGETRWTWRPPRECAVPRFSAADAAVMVVAVTCGRDTLFALDPASGRSRWRRDLASLRDVRLLDGVVAAAGDDRVALLAAADGREITAPVPCAELCAWPASADGRLLVARAAGGAEVISGVSADDGSAPWHLVEGPTQNGDAARHGTIVADGRWALAFVNEADVPGRPVDLIDVDGGAISRAVLPLSGQPFAFRGRTLFTGSYVTASPGRPAWLALTAVDLPRPSSALPSALPSAPPFTPPFALPSARPEPDPCRLVRPGLGVTRRPLGRPPATLCAYTDRAGLRFTVGVWTAANDENASELFRELGAALGTSPLDDVGEEAYSAGPRSSMVVAREGSHILWVSSPYLPLRDRLPVLAAEAAGRLGAAPRVVHEIAGPRPGPVPASSERPMTVLPGTSVTVRDDPAGAVSVAGYREDGVLRLRDGSGRFRPAPGRRVSVSPDDRWLVSFPSPSRVKIVDRTTGRARRVTVPPGANTPSWSPAGLLLTTWEDEWQPNGFVVVDPVSGTTRRVKATDENADLGAYRWNGDGRTVVTPYEYYAHERPPGLRSLDLSGRTVSELAEMGDEVSDVRDPLSPSRSRFLTRCYGRPTDLCVRESDGGRLLAWIEAGFVRVLGWYDDEHLILWQREGTGYRAAVVGLSGETTAVLARTPAPGDKDVEILYTPSRGKPRDSVP